MTVLVSVQNLTKSFGIIQAVRGISFSARAGEILGFLGPNGAGKTTTMRMLTGYLPPDAGHMTMDGLEMGTDNRYVKAQIGYLPEGGPLYLEMRVRELLLYVADLRQLSKTHTHERYAYVVETLGLQPVLHRIIETLSKGYRRRVALALALLHDPKILILDEPTDGLDPNQKHDVHRLLKRIMLDKAIIISTHNLEEVEMLCDRALIMAQGSIVASGTISELITKVPQARTLVDAFRILTTIPVSTAHK